MRVTPIDATTTRISASWLVDENAIEDQDYRIDELIGFSKLVNEEDHEILTEQAKGVISSHYRPGPYSPVKEAAVEHFVAWYVNRLSTGHSRRT
jgi:Rieske 2Fe-2S family protein